MNNSKSTQIKNTIAKIDISKIATYSQEYPKSKTLRQIIKHSKKAFDSQEEEQVSKFAVKVAYNLDKICDPEKVGCVKNAEEKKYWLEISKELFENTIGLKNKA